MWFSSKASQQIPSYIKPKDVKVDMKTSVLKLLQAKWFTFSFDRIKSRSDTILKDAKNKALQIFCNEIRIERKNSHLWNKFYFDFKATDRKENTFQTFFYQVFA